jgi:hypothetical protein
VRQDRLGEQKRAPGVQIDLRVPLINSNISQRVHDGEACIVDENVNLPISAFDGLLNEVLGSIERRKVRFNCKTFCRS